MPCVTSMLVSQPSTMMETAGSLGVTVGVGEGTDVAVSVMLGTLVGIAVFVKVAMAGVEVFAPMTTGVGVWIRGVGVGGKKGVGPDPGWKTQPLQDDSRHTNRSAGSGVLIFFS